MTMATWRSVSATRKLALPSSGAGIASTVYMPLRRFAPPPYSVGRSLERDRGGREQNVDRQQRDGDRSAVEKDLRGTPLRSVHSEVDDQVAQPVREVEERNRDQHEQVELDDRV